MKNYMLNPGKVTEYLAEKKLAEKCTLCGIGKMEFITDAVFVICDYPSFALGKEKYNALILVLPLICEHCGNIYLINAYKQDLLMQGRPCPNCSLPITNEFSNYCSSCGIKLCVKK